MTNNPRQNKPAAETAIDRKESVSLVEPMLLGQTCPARSRLMDLSVELAKKSASFRRSLPPSLLASTATLLRAMNCYYSNLIEGNYTHPVDIERALISDYNADPKKRDLQLEAKSHMAVQQWIDEGALKGKAATVESVRQIHQRFYLNMPEILQWVEDPDTKERFQVVPGEWRHRDVQVGRHVPISPGAVPRFMERFEEAYARLGPSEVILSAAAAHHRLAWIHPFLDGNGRVMRLMSHAMLLDVLDTGALWSVSRGLARKVNDYKRHLAQCDLTRRNDLDGRGNLSEEALVDFTEFFLNTCLDQVNFMESLLQPDQLRARILIWADEEIRQGSLLPKAKIILDALLRHGELQRGEIPEMLGVGERMSRNVVANLSLKGVISSASTRAPLRLAFPAALASRWVPGLFPEQTL